MLDIDRIRQLVDMMVEHDLSEISLRDGDTEVMLRRPSGYALDAAPVVSVSSPGAAPILPLTESKELAADDASSNGLLEIASPMVGTFYTGPDPESPAFVQPGARIHVGSVVCIVEAMKVFNEIKAEIEGTIERILVKNENPVEYGQPLFLVRPE